MVSLLEACRIVLAKHPKEYICEVCETDEFYECILLKKGEPYYQCEEGYYGGTNVLFLPTAVVIKSDGRLVDNIPCCGMYQNWWYKLPFHKYTANEIEELLKTGKKGA